MTAPPRREHVDKRWGPVRAPRRLSFVVEALEPRFLLASTPTGFPGTGQARVAPTDPGAPRVIDLSPDPSPTVNFQGGSVDEVTSSYSVSLTFAAPATTSAPVTATVGSTSAPPGAASAASASEPPSIATPGTAIPQGAPTSDPSVADPTDGTTSALSPSGPSVYYRIPVTKMTNVLRFELDSRPGAAPFVADIAVFNEQGEMMTSGRLEADAGALTLIDYLPGDPLAKPSVIGVALDPADSRPSPTGVYGAALAISATAIDPAAVNGLTALGLINRSGPSTPTAGRLHFPGWVEARVSNPRWLDTSLPSTAGSIGQGPSAPSNNNSPPPWFLPGPSSGEDGPPAPSSAPSGPTVPPAPVSGTGFRSGGSLPVQGSGGATASAPGVEPTAIVDLRLPAPIDPTIAGRKSDDPATGEAAPEPAAVTWRGPAGAPVLGAAPAVARDANPTGEASDSARLSSLILPQEDARAPAGPAGVPSAPRSVDGPRPTDLAPAFEEAASMPGDAPGGPPVAETPHPTDAKVGRPAVRARTRSCAPLLAGLGGSAALFTGLLMPDLDATFRQVVHAHARARRQRLRP